MWVPDKWQDNLLRHFLRTGDYWAGSGWGGFVAILIVGGNFGDLKKLNSIADILEGKVRRASDYYTGTSISPWEYLWLANEHTERYLRWLWDKWENHGVIDSPPRRHMVKKALEAIDEDRANRQD